MAADNTPDQKPRRPGPPSRKLLEKRARRETKAYRRRKGHNYAPYAVGSVVALMILGLIALMIYTTSGSNKLIKTSSGATSNVGEQVPLQSAGHIRPPQKAQYNSDPPTSGQHYSIPGQAPMAWGYYDQPAAPEYWVHNLEHGGVVILHSCQNGCADDQSKIRDFLAGAPKDADFHEVKIVAVSYAVPGHRFALVSWGWRQFMDTWDAAVAERFYEAHINHGPEAIP